MTTVAGNRVRLTLLVVLLTEKKGLTLKIGIFCFVLIINRVLLKPARYFFLIFFFLSQSKSFSRRLKSLFFFSFLFVLWVVCAYAYACARLCVCVRVCARSLTSHFQIGSESLTCCLVYINKHDYNTAYAAGDGGCTAGLTASDLLICVGFCGYHVAQRHWQVRQRRLRLPVEKILDLNTLRLYSDRLYIWAVSYFFIVRFVAVDRFESLWDYTCSECVYLCIL